jgi:hypothetical protein
MFKLDPSNPRDQRVANTFIKNFDPAHYQRLVIQWIVEDNEPFTKVESAGLLRVFNYLSPSIEIRDAHMSPTWVRKKIVDEFHKYKKVVVEALKNSPGQIHISFDGWRAPNRLSMYGIACFYRNQNNKPCKIILGIPEIGRHLGTSIGAEVLDTIDSFGINDKVGYFVLDNATNNDTAMKVIGDELGFMGSKRRGRCIGHTLNLSAKALLFGNDVRAFEEQLSGEEAMTKEEYVLWREKGPVGKLHNLTVDINRSDRYVFHLFISIH